MSLSGPSQGSGERVPEGISIGVALAIAVVALWTFRFAPDSHFQDEMEIVRANAARFLADWFPHYSETAMMIAAPALATTGTFLPGVWIYHVLAMLVFGPDPSAQFGLAVLLHVLCAWSVGSLAAAMYRDRRAGWAGLVFALFPALGDIHGALANGPALLAMFWALQAGFLYRRFTVQGGSSRLVGAALLGFLAVSCDGIGIFALALMAAIEIVCRRDGPPMRPLARAGALAVVAIPAVTFNLVLALSRLPTNGWEAAVTPGFGQFVRAYLYAFKGSVAPDLDGAWTSLLAVVLGSCVYIAGVYRSLEDPRRLANIGLFVVAVALSAADFADPAQPTSTLAVAYLAPAVCAALILGDVFRAIDSRVTLAAVLVAMTVFWSIVDTHRSRVPVERGRRIAAVGDELARLYGDMKDETDIYLVDDGIDRTVLLAGHLDFVYRFDLTHQTRWSLVIGGMVFPDEPGAIVGKLGAVTRLEVTNAMVFIGWGDAHEHLVDMTPAIRERLAIAEKVMDASGYRVEPFPIGGENAVTSWVPRVAAQTAPGGSPHAWFLEAPIIRLHSTIGRFGPDE
ncbi:MAG: hypothetical protein KJ042_02160 [Deltaproteobacteria bacterium]|nr:hypothetical protein [Deltaproteobacteria bacterium]